MRLFYRVEEVARLMGVSDQTVRRWIHDGQLEARRMGRPFLVPLDAIARLIGKSPAETAQLLEDHGDIDVGRRVPDLPAQRKAA